MTSVVDRNSVNRVQVVWWGRGLEAKAGAGECVFLAVTSLLVLLLLSFLGRTGLLADLLPSFAVEIMPGIQSFRPSITQSSVILSVYPFAASLCGVHFTQMCVLPGDKKRKACRLLGKCVGLRSERADAGSWGRNGHAGSQHTEMVDVMPGSVWSRNASSVQGRFYIKLSALPLLAQRSRHSSLWDLSSLVCPYGFVRQLLLCSSNFRAPDAILRVPLQPSPQMVAQEVLEIEHWLVTHQWHSPSCAAWSGHYLGNTNWLDQTWKLCAHDKSLASQTNESHQFWHSLQRKQTVHQIVLEREKLWEHLALESSDHPLMVPKECFFHTFVQQCNSTWMCEAIFKSVPEMQMERRQTLPHLQCNPEVPGSSAWQERAWSFQQRQNWFSVAKCFFPPAIYNFIEWA